MFPTHRSKIFLAAALGVFFMSSSCGTTGSIYGPDEGPTPEGRLFGEYLAGSYASEIEDASARSDYYSRAFARAPQDSRLGERAITAALANGDEALARALSIEMMSLDPSSAIARLVLGANDMRQGRYARAAKRLAEQPDNPALGVMIAYIEAWAEYGAGNSQDALDIFSSIEPDGYFNIISMLQKAKIYAELGQDHLAETNFSRVDNSGLSRIQTLMAKARYLVADGRLDEALSELKAFDAEMGGIETGPIYSAITAIENGQAIGTSRSPAQHAADTLIDPAGAIFAQQGAYNMAEIYLRLALMLDPDNQNARLWLANVLERMERIDDARTAYVEIPERSDYSVSARLSHSNLLFREQEDDQAVAMLSKLYNEHPAIITREALGTAYLIKEDYANALPVYDQLVHSASQAQLRQDPTVLYHRGICYEQLDMWEQAEADFQRVLELDPDYADALNYLGYTWVDRGENLGQAFDMIRKAVELEPESGAIIDSLGWAHFKLGQYSEARHHLEDASEKSPDSATIIDHLGDVYWKLGRFLEASYQWQRALDLDPTDKERRAIEIKLRDGYDAAQNLP